MSMGITASLMVTDLLRSSLTKLFALSTHAVTNICTLQYKVRDFLFSNDTASVFLKMSLDDETLRRRRPGKLASCTVDFVYREFPFPTIQPTTSPRRRR